MRNGPERLRSGRCGPLPWVWLTRPPVFRCGDAESVGVGGRHYEADSESHLFSVCAVLCLNCVRMHSRKNNMKRWLLSLLQIKRQVVPRVARDNVSDPAQSPRTSPVSWVVCALAASGLLSGMIPFSASLSTQQAHTFKVIWRRYLYCSWSQLLCFSELTLSFLRAPVSLQLAHSGIISLCYCPVSHLLDQHWLKQMQREPQIHA